MSVKTGVKHIDMKQLTIFDDLSPHKLHRKNAPSTSKDAAYSVPLAKTRAFVLGLIEEAGEKGITVKEMDYHQIGFRILYKKMMEKFILPAMGLD